jgi:hypothetical protein
MIPQTNNKMIAISKAPYITFHQVPRESVLYATHIKMLEPHYEKPLRVKSMAYDGDSMEAVTVSVDGRDVTVALGRVGMSYDMQFQMIDVSRPMSYDNEVYHNKRFL